MEGVFLHEVTNEQSYSMFKLSWDLTLVTFRTPMVSVVTVWEDTNQSSKYSGPHLFLFTISCVVNCPQEAPKMACSIMFKWSFPGFILSSQSCNYHFQRRLAFTQAKGLEHLIFSVGSLLHSLLLGFFFCLFHVLSSPK